MKQVLIQKGAVVVEEVPTPLVGNKNILVRVQYSCISVGTESAGIKMSGLPLWRRALQQPENFDKVVEMARQHGIKRTLKRVLGQLSFGTPTGYSAAGIVIGVGHESHGFAIGDRVACAGAGIANHAEVIDVHCNLAVKIPDNVDMESASTATLGSIALQGIRRAQPTMGETFLVIGLGLLGQLTTQMLLANGCRVIGTDLDASLIKLAEATGFVGLDPSAEDVVASTLRHTAGHGADGVIITAATASQSVIRQAMQACRKKGRVVLVGDVGLNLVRSDFYKKEIDFLISCSYGPGRYDSSYEEGGIDYPLPYVRWTENRNLQAFLQLLADKKIDLKRFYSKPYAVADAPAAYASLKDPETRPLLALLAYGEPMEMRRVDLKQPQEVKNKIRVALIGASSFAQGMHLPNLVKLRKDYVLHAVMSRTGANAKVIATQYKANYCSTDYAAILNDPDVDLVLIATRHNLHSSMVLQALKAGKHVFVEKPLALSEEELVAIEDFYKANEGPLLMTGFNRRFAPAIQKMRALLKNRTTPLIANYRMNAGFLPSDHWVHGPEGGGRNIGEACHIYDLFDNLCNDSPVVSITAKSIRPISAQWHRNDNFVATLQYSDGSVCTLTYTALGYKSYPKERMEVFADGKVLAMDDYKKLDVFGGKGRGWHSKTIQKGQLEELECLADTLLRGADWPISFASQLQATRISLEIERQLKNG
ncbi:MAG: oxidoreductase [Verrucomicrobia bacterium GWF2_51_19]|nr:MAG: oxidoreductase [Verrucomicrobia bacterium GWF2_51_19]HCJ11992.1 oxidoreductase [Opitutae bacterium]